MINARQSLRYSESGEGMNITPLIDLIFLLLIFFMVTTSFVKETGLDVDRPTAATARDKKEANIMIGVGEDGRIFMDHEPIDIRMVRPHVENAMAEHPGAAAVIVADRKSDTGLVIEVLDQCRLAGANNVSIAARRQKGS
jgi:biopolymer transport protein ExbD